MHLYHVDFECMKLKINENAKKITILKCRVDKTKLFFSENFIYRLRVLQLSLPVSICSDFRNAYEFKRKKKTLSALWKLVPSRSMAELPKCVCWKIAARETKQLSVLDIMKIKCQQSNLMQTLTIQLKLTHIFDNHFPSDTYSHLLESKRNEDARNPIEWNEDEAFMCAVCLSVVHSAECRLYLLVVPFHFPAFAVKVDNFF